MQCDDVQKNVESSSLFDENEVTLIVDDLCFGYASKDNLAGINIEAKKGEFVALMGPNGSGKTTLMRCINKILKHRDGSIIITGRDTKDLNCNDISKLCTTVPADIPADFSLSVKEFVTLGRSPFVTNWWWEKEEDEIIVEEAMWDFGVTMYGDRKLFELSSGERARVLLAKGVVQNPKVMLVDEPSAHLDMKYKAQVMELLKGLSRKGITIIMASHDVNFVTRYCDKIYLLGKGHILDYGTPEEVINEKSMKEIFETDVVCIKIGGIIYVLPRPPEEKSSEE